MNYVPALTLAALLAFTGAAQAGVISQSKPKITQVKIVHSGQDIKSSGPAQPDSWGIASNYIGPGDINRLRAIDIYLDSYNRISAVKVTRESYTGDLVTSVFTDVLELGIQTLQPGASRPSKETPVTIRTADGLVFP